MSFYVYIHKKKTTGEVFYVGKGTRDRDWIVKGRNPIWTKIYKKHGCVVEILANNLQEWYAFELESNLIDYYGKIVDGRGTLANLADGGETPSGEGSVRGDKTLYTFFNLVTSERITTTRLLFRKKNPSVFINGLMTGIVKVSKNWAVEGKITEADIEAFLSGYKGVYSKTLDKTKYNFVKLSTGEVFNLTRHELVEFDSSLAGSNLAHLITGAVRTYKGWAMEETLKNFSIECLINPLKGDRSRNSDKNSYVFKNLTTGELFEGTRSEFKNKHNIDPFTLFLKSKNCLTVGGWCLISKEKEALRTTAQDRTIYKLEHKTGEIFIGTRKEFKEKFKYAFDKLVAPTNPQKTHKGWKLVN